MMIRHNALVLVGDGQKYMLLRNAGDLSNPVLAYEGGGEQASPATRDQGSDEPGRAFSSVGSIRSAMSETDFHQLDKDRFAGEMADMLDRLAQAGEFDDLVVVAPPRTLAELRKNFGKQVSSRVTAEVAKDLTNHNVDEIAQILSREE